MARTRSLLIAAAVLLGLVLPPSSGAGETSRLEQRVRELERQNVELLRRLTELERRQGPAAAVPQASTAATTDVAASGAERVPVVAPPSPSGATAKRDGAETQPFAEILDETESPGLGLQARYGSVRASFQIFGDAGFGYRNPPKPGSETAFGLGALDFFTTAQLGEHFQTLSEFAFEGNSETNETDFDLERLWGAWVLNDAFYLKLGREHSPSSVWNRRYHHGRWLWTSATQPFLARFEDGGGPLPVHEVGLEIGGRLATTWGALDYTGVVANGRGRDVDEVQNVVDHNQNKALDFSLEFEPAALRGLTIGGNLYVDEIPTIPDDPTRQHGIGERIESASLQYFAGHVETIGEIAFFQHDDRTSDHTFHHQSGYLQLGYHLGRYTPFARFDAQAMERGDPFFAPGGIDNDQWEPMVGLRYEVNDNVAIKIEVAGGRTERPSVAGASTWESFTRLALQLAWVF